MGLVYEESMGRGLGIVNWFVGWEVGFGGFLVWDTWGLSS